MDHPRYGNRGHLLGKFFPRIQTCTNDVRIEHPDFRVDIIGELIHRHIYADLLKQRAVNRAMPHHDLVLHRLGLHLIDVDLDAHRAQLDLELLRAVVSDWVSLQVAVNDVLEKIRPPAKLFDLRATHHEPHKIAVHASKSFSAEIGVEIPDGQELEVGLEDRLLDRLDYGRRQGRRRWPGRRPSRRRCRWRTAVHLCRCG